MKWFSPRSLLENPGAVLAEAPWCRTYDPVEMGVLLATHPIPIGDGLNRGQIDTRLRALADDLPLGHVYYQRVNRAVAHLDDQCALRGEGRGRNRCFSMTPEGFVGLVLNLQVLRSDPTIDGSEFELKREIVAMWNLLLMRLAPLIDSSSLPPALVEFYQQVAKVKIAGEPVLNDRTFRPAFDIGALVDQQRKRVQRFRDEAVRQHTEAIEQTELLTRPGSTGVELPPELRNNPEVQRIVREFATSGIPELSFAAKISRYEAYLSYLDQLDEMYGPRLELDHIDSLGREMAIAGG